jgi:hypothetical protein
MKIQFKLFASEDMVKVNIGGDIIPIKYKHIKGIWDIKRISINKIFQK